MLKVELHSHINLDPMDKGDINYNAKKLIDEMHRRGYDVLAITCHDYYYKSQTMREYARSLGMVLIDGVELTMEDGKETLIYNAPRSVLKVRNLDELREFKEDHPEILIVAPHPFMYGSKCHRENLKKYKDLFDAYEFSFFYTRFFNQNKKTVRLAKKFGKPVVGNCDIHSLNFEGNVYSLVESRKDKDAILQAVRDGRVEFVAKPMSSKRFTKLFFKVGFKVLLCRMLGRNRSRH